MITGSDVTHLRDLNFTLSVHDLLTMELTIK